MSEKSIIEIHGLSKIFYRNKKDAVEALSNIELLIDTPGQIIQISGANGSGKTTLLKCIAGLITPTRGSIAVLGTDITTSSHLVRKHIGMITDQERSFYWRLTGKENLLFFSELNDIKKTEALSKIYRLAEKLDVANLLDKPFSTYSTGTRQRFSIMRALLHEPSIMLLDEPDRSLDTTAREHLKQILQSLSEEKKITTVYTTPLAETPLIENARRVTLAGGVLQA